MAQREVISATDFFSALNQHCEGVVELRILPSGQQRYFDDAQSIESCLPQYANQDIYFGVATRQDNTSGKLENCEDLGALFTDLDFTDQPGDYREKGHAWACHI